ncbi:MAG: hypothetical protein MJ232_00190 [archaeon]|nr:hypothetical protein [archaeon]
MDFKNSLFFVSLLIILCFGMGTLSAHAEDISVEDINDEVISDVGVGEVSDDDLVFDVGLDDDSDVGTFSELADKVSGSDKTGTIILDKDYINNDSYDSEGILIDGNNLIIRGAEGKCITIDANTNSRIFKIKGNNITFMDFNFINGNCVEDGGAIYYNLVSNTTQLHFINCNFINNTASENCGAIYGYYKEGTYTPLVADIINCSFINNSALNIGAVSGCYAINCVFINNSAFGVEGSVTGLAGAMYAGSAVNCYFEGNFANYYGGAMYDNSALNRSFALNCSFINNSANYGYGAMMGDCAVDCIFINNTSGIDCGAFSGAAINCVFINNSALGIIESTGGYGGAMNGGSALYCSFINNFAACKGGATYNTYVNYCTFENNSYLFEVGIMLDYNNISSINYGSSKKSKIEVTDRTVGIYQDFTYSIKIYSGSKLIKTLTFDSYESPCDAVYYDFSKLPVGKYKLMLELNNSRYVSDNNPVYLTVLKASTIVSAPKVTYKYKSNKYFKVTIKHKSTKKVVRGLAVKIKVYTGKKYKTYTVKTNSKGVAKLSTKYLKKGKHKVVISSGNKNYNVSKKGTLIVIK